MKSILLLIFFAFAIVSVSCLRKPKRSLANEGVALQLEYLGSCETFNTFDSPSVKISAPASGASTCLPIATGGLDDDSYTSDYFCSDIGHNRAVVHFVEVFLGTDTPANTQTKFIVSFVPSRPFRVHVSNGVYSYSRRPSCGITNTYCSPSTPYVTSCTHNNVTLDRKYVMNHDRIYIAVNTTVADGCQNTGACCGYIGVTGTASYICPYTAPSTLNTFPRKEHFEHVEHHNDDGDHHHRPQEHHNDDGDHHHRPQEHHNDDGDHHHRPQEHHNDDGDHHHRPQGDGDHDEDDRRPGFDEHHEHHNDDGDHGFKKNIIPIKK